MLHIILLLLKIIGIILLLILALILLILGIVLFAPISYQAEGSFYGKPDLSARIRWLFIVLKADIDYHEGKLDITAKVLHKTIVSKHTGDRKEESLEADEVHQPHDEAQPEQNDAQPEQSETQPEQSEVQPEQSEVQPEQSEVQPEQSEAQPEQSEAQPEQSEVQPEQSEVQLEQNAIESDQSQESVDSNDPASKAAEHNELSEQEKSSDSDTDKTIRDALHEPTDTVTAAAENTVGKEAFTLESETSGETQTDLPTEEPLQAQQDGSTSKGPGPVQRIMSKLKGMIKKITEKKKTSPPESLAADSSKKVPGPSLGEKAGAAIDRLIDKMDDTADKIDEKLEGIEKKNDGLEEKAGFIDKLLQTEYIQKTILFVLRMLKAIGLHILPRRLSGKIHFGLGNPATTGKILGYSSILYPVYANTLELIPDFEQSVAEGELKLKGRIQLGLFVIWIFKGLLNKNVRKTIKLALRIKKTKSFKEDILWQ